METRESCGVGCYLCECRHIRSFGVDEAWAMAAQVETHMKEKYMDLLHTHFVFTVTVEAPSVFE